MTPFGQPSNSSADAERIPSAMGITDAYIKEVALQAYAQRNRDVYVPETDRDVSPKVVLEIYTAPVTKHITVIRNANRLIMGDNAQMVEDYSTTFNFQNCNIDLRGNLNDLAYRLTKDEMVDEAEELSDAAKMLAEIESIEEPQEVKGSAPAGRLKQIVEALYDEESTLHKAVKGIKKGISVAQDIAEGYNSIAQWAGLPQVPKPFLKK